MPLGASYVVNYGGKFHNLAAGTVEYKDGTIEIVECEAGNLLRAISKAIPSQRLWYKLSDECLDELKVLWGGGDSFGKFCDMSKSAEIIEIYMEEDESDSVIGQSQEAQNNERAEQSQNVEPQEDQNVEPQKAETDEPKQNEEVHFDADDRVEAVIADINDDESDAGDAEGLPTTPICSDAEDVGEKYEKYVRGSGDLKIEQLFTSGEEFKEGVLNNSLKGGWNVKYARWGPIKYEAICEFKKKEQCQWRIYCSYDERSGGFLVKTFNDTHSCMKNGRLKLLTDNVIAKMFVNELRINPKMQPKDMQARIEEKYNVVCTHDQVRKAKKKGLQIIQAEYDEQYSKIKDYAKEIQR